MLDRTLTTGVTSTPPVRTTVTIIDTDPAVTVSFGEATYEFDEGERTRGVTR